MLFKKKAFSTWAYNVLFKYYNYSNIQIITYSKICYIYERERFFIGKTITSILRKDGIGI